MKNSSCLPRLLYSLILGFCMLLPATAQQPAAYAPDTDGQTLRNRAIYDRIALALQDDTALPLPRLVVQVALQLLGTPYVAATLESEPERLQVFLDKTDCILYVELSVCLALTLKGCRIVQAGDGRRFVQNPIPSLAQDTPSYALLLDNIRNMRYRLGVVDGYASRLHYTSEWLLQNSTNGILYEYTRELGQEFDQQFFYMSAHPEAYSPLSRDVCELGKIRMIEELLNSQKPYFFITQDSLRRPGVMAAIQTGDIITFISPRPGLDLAHVAIAYELPDGMHFLHASYAAGKVIIEPRLLADYAPHGLRISRLSSLP
ncbi:MAG: DUF1460 domain-containing protein [Paludibacteraceae bacterium]|nr:DUF1460 domain-containing protein [Paludibacteraceae bacterium]